MENEKNIHESLEERVALHCSLIGIGNAGNQLVNVAYANNIEVFALNTSAQDMHKALVSDHIKSFIIGDEGRGAGKNRKTALQYFKYNGKELLTKVPSFTSMIERSDVVFVAGSTAGGTGSALCPVLIRYLKQFYPTKIIIYVGFIPRESAAVQEQTNSVQCLEEITSLNIPYILADLNYYADVPNDTAYSEVQKYVIDCINVIRGKYINKSPFGMMDENDMRTVIAEPGYLSIYNLSNVTQNQLDKETMQSMMIKLIKHSPAVDIMRDGIVRQMAAIINVPDDLSDASRASNYDELKNYIGNPLAIFENYAILPMSATGQMILMLSGQTMPYTRVSLMTEKAHESEEIYNKQKHFDIGSLIGDLDIDNNVQYFVDKSTKEDSTTQSDLSDFFDNL